MSIEIYYFSGTGNSLHVARELQARLPESTLTPMVRLLHEHEPIKTRADIVGFVFPNFCVSIPIPLHAFLHRVDLASAQYLFGLCTRGGTISEAFEYINQIIAPQGKKLNAELNVNMPWNHPVGKENVIALTKDDETRRALEAAMQHKLDVFSQAVLAR